MPSLRAFEVLVAIADAGSVSGAARRLHLTQPAISHQLASLERELGTALVDRMTQGAVLTRHGRAVIEHARTALAAASRAVTAAHSADGGEPIRLAAVESFTIPYVVPVASNWHTHNRTRIHLTEASTAMSLLDGLREASHDLILVPGPLDTHGLYATQIGTERLVVLGRGISPNRPVPLERLRDHELIGVDPHNGFHEWLAQQAAHTGIPYNPTVIVRSLQKAAALADAGFGIAIVPASALSRDTSAAEIQPALQRPILAVTRTPHDPAVRELITQFQRHLTAVLPEG